MKRLSPDVIIGGILLIFCLTVYLIIPSQPDPGAEAI
jgi:hypothetical protein